MNIRDIPKSARLLECIQNDWWIPEESGLRPFANAEEASIISDEILAMVGTNWRYTVVSLGETSGVFYQWLPYTDLYNGNVTIEYKELFMHYEVAGTLIPCGVPCTIPKET